MRYQVTPTPANTSTGTGLASPAQELLFIFLAAIVSAVALSVIAKPINQISAKNKIRIASALIGTVVFLLLIHTELVRMIFALVSGGILFILLAVAAPRSETIYNLYQTQSSAESEVDTIISNILTEIENDSRVRRKFTENAKEEIKRNIDDLDYGESPDEDILSIDISEEKQLRWIKNKIPEIREEKEEYEYNDNTGN